MKTMTTTRMTETESAPLQHGSGSGSGVVCGSRLVTAWRLARDVECGAANGDFVWSGDGTVM